MNSIRVVPIEGLFNIDTGKLVGLRQQGAPADREPATPVTAQVNDLTGGAYIFSGGAPHL